MLATDINVGMKTVESDLECRLLPDDIQVYDFV